VCEDSAVREEVVAGDVIRRNQRAFGTIVRKYHPNLEALESLYKDLHRHPELSRREARTASVIASQLRSLGFDVHVDIGGHGVAGVFRNGLGPVVLLRAELDALPIQEQLVSRSRAPNAWRTGGGMCSP